jgi:hypothetical protein
MPHLTYRGSPVCTWSPLIFNRVAADHSAFVICGYRNREGAEKALDLVRKLNPDIDPDNFGFSDEPCPESDL